MYRKGLSSRANKVSSLTASTDNSSTGMKGQAQVPTAGINGIRKNVFRMLPLFPPSKNKSRFSKMSLWPRPFPFTSKQQLIDAITMVSTESTTNTFKQAITKYGTISSWNISAITDLSSLFENNTTFNHDINGWNTSRVTNMNNMFKGATAFNQDISSWNVTSVTSMTSMFQNATAFDQNISSWNPDAITDDSKFNLMFDGATQMTSQFLSNNNDGYYKYFKPPVVSINGAATIEIFLGNTYSDQGATSTEGLTVTDNSNLVNTSVTGTYTVTYTATDTSGKIDTATRTVIVKRYKPGNDTELRQAVNAWFDNNAQALINYGAIGTWDITSVGVSLNLLFQNRSTFNDDISAWDVSNISSMREMFEGATNFNQDISSWNMSNVTTTRMMFKGATNFNQPIGSWNVSKVTDMISMFEGATSFDKPIGSWNVSNVTNMMKMFSDATSFNKDISNWNTSKVGTMNSMFKDAEAFNQDIRKWDVSNVADNELLNMFQSATAMKSTFTDLVDNEHATNLAWFNSD